MALTDKSLASRESGRSLTLSRLRHRGAFARFLRNADHSIQYLLNKPPIRFSSPVGSGSSTVAVDGRRHVAAAREAAETPTRLPKVDAADWDRKYEGRELVYGEAPNATLVEVATTLERGRALDLASGQGRNAIWLATRGWTVDAVDFSSVALTKASRVAASAPRSVRERLTWVHADVTQLSTEPNYDLVLMFYLHLPPNERRAAVSTAVSALKPDGILMILGHHTANIESGIGGPQEAEILYTPEDLASDIGSRLTVLTAENRYRDVTGGTAIDALLLASRSPLGSEPDRG